ncbi:MAG: hypothetical protein ACREP8_06670 [Candidatus Binatia bacterium]
MKAQSGKRKAQSGRKATCCLLTVGCCLMFFLGCGKKGDPRAPELAMPETIRDLRAGVEDRGVVLTWSRPTRYVDGKDLRDLAGFVIFRKDVSKNCPDCPVPYRQRAEVNVEDQEKFVKKREYRFVDQELTPQTIYRYRVFSKLRDGSLSEPSNEVEAAWRP